MEKAPAIGDTVGLNSGGPAMTVVTVFPPDEGGPHAYVRCSWIGEDGNGHEHTFPVPCVRKVSS